MFGTLRPGRRDLSPAARREHHRFYCGLCQSVGQSFGQPWRALHSHDAVFMSLLADGLAAEAAAPDRCRCPMMPLIHRPTVSPESPAMRYAAALQMLLGDQKLADRAAEGGAAARLARPLVAG